MTRLWTDWVGALAADTIGGSEKMPVLEGATAAHVTPDLLKTYIISALTGVAAITPTTGDALIVERSGTEGTFDLDALASYVIASGWTVATEVTPATSADKFLIDRAGTKYELDIDTVATYVNSAVLDLTVLDAATPVDSDLLLFGSGSTPKKITVANFETELWSDFASYVNGLTKVVTTAADDRLYCIQGGTPKYVTPTELAAYIVPNAGDVIAPATQTPTNIPQWSSTADTLTDGLSLVTTVRTVAGGASDTALATEQAIRELIGDVTELDIDGTTDIGAALADADLFIVDDGAIGLNRKCAASRLKTYAQTIKLDDFATPDDNTDLDATTLLHGLMSKTDKSKLDGIEALADVTDATNVNAAGATMNTDTDVSGNSWVLDEDNMVTNDATKVATQQSIKAYVDANIYTGAITTLDIDGAADIAAALADVDLIIVDDGAGGTNRKAAMSRVWTYVETKIQGLTAKTTPVDADILVIQDSAASNALKELTVANLWDNRYLTDAQAIKLDDFSTPDDNTDLDATTLRHGLLPKLGGGSTNFLRADGTWSAPPGAAGGEANTASNVGSGQDIFKQKTGADLEFRGITGTGNVTVSTNGDNIEVTTSAATLPVGYKNGLITSNGTDSDHDIDITTGDARDSTDTHDLSLSSAMTKQIDATWAAGTAAGGLFSGTVAADTYYYVYLIRKDSDGTIDAGFDTSTSAANIPVGYTYYRRIGSVLTDSSSNILPFTQQGKRFTWRTRVNDYNDTTPPLVGSAVQTTCQVPRVSGVTVTGVIFIQSTGASAVSGYVMNGNFAAPSTNDNFTTFASAAGTDNRDTARYEIPTDSSGRVWVWGSAVSGFDTFVLQTTGFVDEFE